MKAKKEVQDRIDAWLFLLNDKEMDLSSYTRARIQARVNVLVWVVKD